MYIDEMRKDLELCKVSFRHIAKHLGVSHATFSDWMNKKRDMPLHYRVRLYREMKTIMSGEGLVPVVRTYFMAKELQDMAVIVRIDTAQENDVPGAFSAG